MCSICIVSSTAKAVNTLNLRALNEGEEIGAF